MDTIKKLIDRLQKQKIKLVLKGDHLDVVAYEKKLSDSQIKEIKTHKRAIVDYLKEQAQHLALQNAPIPKVKEASSYLLSNAQRRLWLASQLEAGSAAYNMPGTVVLDGTYDVGLFQYAVHAVIARHEILRTVFKPDDTGEPRQYILTVEALGFEVIHQDYRSQPNSEATAKAYIDEDAYKPFDLASGPLIRIALLRLATNKYVCYVNMHHIISDGWSMEVMLRDLMAFYQAALSNNAPSLAPLPIQYKDYAAWQSAQLESPDILGHERYWRKQFSNQPPLIDLPSAQKRPQKKSYNGQGLSVHLSPTLTAQLRNFTMERGEGLFTGFLAVLKVLLYHYTNESDITVGSLVAGRDHADLQGQIGFYVNTLALRSQINLMDSFEELFEQIKNTAQAAQAYQSYPFDKLLECLNIKWPLGRSPLFDVSINYHGLSENYGLNSFLYGQTDEGNETDDGIKFLGERLVKFDLEFHPTETVGGIMLTVNFNCDIYSPVMVRRLMVHYQKLLESLLNCPRQPIHEVVFLSEAEQERLTMTLNASSKETPKRVTFIDLFEAVVLKNPEAVAVVFESTTLTYSQLDRQTNQLARYLQMQGVGKDTLTPICVTQPLDMIIGILSILKAGGAYVPIDAAHPQQRIDFILSDIQCTCVLTSLSLEHLFGNQSHKVATIYLDNLEEYSQGYAATPLSIKPESGHLAYVIYTSGTTGLPKGVMIEHGNLYDYLYGLTCQTQMELGDVHGLMSTPAADLGNTVLFGALATGGTLHLFAKDTLADAAQLVSHFDAHRIGFIKITPSHWSSLGEGTHVLLPKKAIIFGGEALTGAIIDKIRCHHPSLEIFNHYGPTETTIGKLMYRVNLAQKYDTVPLGRVFSDAQVYILGSAGQLLPEGVTGEIHIAGAGVARGYLNRDALTAERFVTCPFGSGGRMYKTGDMGYWQPDGHLVFSGRSDHQVKVRGYRVELGEITAVLNEIDGVSQSVITAINADNSIQNLVAYVVGTASQQAIKQALGRKLPEYMVPNAYIFLATIPLTSNGKIDYKALPSPDLKGIKREEYVAPVGEGQTLLAGLWKEVLGLVEIGANDDFFELGGNSLSAIRLVGLCSRTFQKRITVKDIFDYSDLASQAEFIVGAAKADYEWIGLAEKAESYPLSNSQLRIWTACQLEESSVAYNMPNTVVLEGSYEVPSLQRACDAVVERHEILRTVFKANDVGEISQYVLPISKTIPAFSFEDFCPHENPEKAALTFIKRDAGKSFDLSKGPLLRIYLFRLKEGYYVLYYNMHHIISDQLSMEVLSRDLMHYYNAFLHGEKPSLPALRFQYKDYAVWQTKQQKSLLMEEHKQYWLALLQGEIPPIDLPSQKQRPLVKAYKGQYLHFNLSSEETTVIKSFAQAHKGTLFMALLAAWKVMVYRYTGETDIVTGSPIAGRNHADLKDQIGFYVNILPLRHKVNPQESFERLFAQIKTATLQAYQHQAYPFDQMVEDLALQRDTTRNPLFDIILNYHGTYDLDKGFANKGGLVGFEHQKVKFDLELHFTDVADGLDVLINYDEAIYERPMVAGLANHFKSLLIALVNSPTAALGQIAYLEHEERHRLLRLFSGTQSRYPKDKALPSLFQKQAAATPHAVAVECQGVILTYRALDERANQLAHYLMDTCGVVPGSLVGFKLARNEWVPVALLAILKAGCAYVPIDTNYPEKRIALIEEDCKLVALVTNEMLHRFENQAARPKTPPDINITAESLAYVMYTSGSTGHPKGVMITHQSVVSLSKSMNYYTFSPSDTLLATGALAFDATTFEYWGTLLNGARLVICPRETLLDSAAFAQQLKDKSVNVIWLTTGWLNQLVDTRISLFAPLKTILIGGDKLSPKHIGILREAYPDLEIINGYGPTENTTFSLTHNIVEVDGELPIGKPIYNSTAYVLDEHLEVQPVGVTGEIYLGGDGLALGYLNQPELTTEKFVPSPFDHQARLYKTGDLGRWRRDGIMEFVGRKDVQVKVRGYRIELGEIEHALMALSEVKQAIVVAKNIDQSTTLVAYIEPNGKLERAKLKTGLSASLPRYMVPTYYVILDVIPLTSNGKVDRKALPTVSEEDLVRQQHVPPRNETEEALVRIWEAVLGITGIGVTDNFFELGGHSLKVTLVTNKVKQELGLLLTVKNLFANPTIEGIVPTLYKSGYGAIPKAKSQNSYALAPSQRRLWALSQFEEGSLAYTVPGAFEVHGHLEIARLETALNKIVSRHESLRTVFKYSEEAGVRQYILPSADINLDIEEEDLWGIEHQNFRVEKALEKAYGYRFSLERGPLIKLWAVRLDPEQWLLLFNMHHIISDGWSMEVLVKELMAIYSSLAQENSMVLPTLPIQYKDYVAWLESPIQQEKMVDAEGYWTKQFSGDLPILKLPVSHERPKSKTFNGDTHTHTFVEGFGKSLHAFAEKNEVSLFMVLMAGVNGLFSRYAQTGDIIIGTPVAGRSHADLEGQIGLFLNTLAIRTRFDTKASFKTLLSAQKTILLDAYAHQEYPLDSLVEQLGLRRDKSHAPLFDVMVALQNQQGLLGHDGLEIDGLAIKPYTGYEKKTSQFDLSFMFEELGGRLSLRLQYNTDIYEPTFITRMIAHFKAFLSNCINDPNISIAQVNYLSEAERQQLLHKFNKTKTAYPREATIVSLFAEQVAKSPEAVAVVYRESQLSYIALDKLSNQLANYLLKRYDLSAEDFIGVKLSRDTWPVVCFLGILKAGCAYVPIDINYPAQRVTYITDNSGCKVVIDEEVIKDFRNKKDIPISCPKSSIKPNSLAYVMYTSGSTGQPKGTLVEHRAIIRLVKNTNYIEENNVKRILGLSSFSFDGATFDIYMPILNGGTLIIADKDIFLDFEHFADLLTCQDIESFFVTTALFNTIVEAQVPSVGSVKCILFGGEQVSVPHVRQFKALYPQVELHHVYGPTENTTFSSYFPIQAVPASLRSIPIGAGISNSTCYILDEYQNLVPIGVAGELYVGGDGLARGYLKAPELTAQRFVDSQVLSGERLYRTGDLAVWQEDGQIEFIGRKDNQVKIRGHRIELDEVERALVALEEVQQAVVSVKQTERGRDMVAYLVSAHILDKQVLREILGGLLPDYMLPAYFVQLDSMPLTVNGKIDTKALPEIGDTDRVQRQYEAPVTELEKQLVAIWEHLLKIQKIGVKDDFFDLGGNSLSIAKLANEYHKTLNVKVGIKALFERSTIAGHAKFIAGLSADNFNPIVPVPKAASYALSNAQLRMWVASLSQASSIAYNMPNAINLPSTYDLDNFEKAIHAVIARHEILRTVFEEKKSGEPRQHILSTQALAFEISRHDFNNQSDPEACVKDYMESDALKPFDLRNGPLLRASLLLLPGRSVFYYNMHHIIGDGWSMDVLSQDVLRYYEAYELGKPEAIAPLQIQYKDYAAWQRAQSGSDAYKAHEKYWLGQFREAVPPVNLPSTLSRPKVKTYLGQSVGMYLDSGLVAKLRSLVMRQKGTLFMGLLTVWNALVCRYTGEKDITLGCSVTGREHADLKDQIGFYVNVLPLRNTIDPSIGFQVLCQQIIAATLKAFEHQNYPFDDLVENLDTNRDFSRSPLFDILINYHGEKGLAMEKAAGIQHLGDTMVKFDMVINMAEASGTVGMVINYNREVYEYEMVTKLLHHYERLLSCMLENPQQSIGSMMFLTEQEHTGLLSKAEGNRIAVPSELTIVSLVDGQAQRTPDAEAILYEDTVLTYGVLRKCSNQLAHYLKKVCLVVPGDVVGLELPRNEWLPITMLAVLKVGAAYVPIDPNYPKERVDFIKSDANCKVSITPTLLQNFNPNSFPDSLPDVGAEASGLAYVIYTSGSTGKPKGVMIGHSQVVSFLYWAKSAFENTHFNIMYATTSYCFDLSVFEFYYPLSIGKKVRVLENGLAIEAHLCEDEAVFVNTVPSVVDHLCGGEVLWEKIAAINMAGESIPVVLSNRLDWENITIRNLYGPSEDTTYSSCYLIDKQHTHVLPIGRPIGNTQFYLLSEQLGLQPEGVVGELCIAGDGLSMGYLNQPELTAEKFVPCPFEQGQIMYRTGDLARWLPNGEMVFMGRIDDQVKIRGYRIELSEIENILLQESTIAQAVVLAKGHNEDKSLVAFIVGDMVDVPSLRSHLSQKLPNYMIPASFGLLEAIPTLPNGKVDKKALLKTDTTACWTDNYVPPRNKIEEKIAQIWQTTLKREKIGVLDNFFEIGGNSLKATKAILAIREAFEVQIDLQQVFAEPTIAFLAITIENHIWSKQENKDLKKIIV